MTTWAQMIQDLEEAGVNQQDICDEIGLKPGSVSDIKCGRSAAPRGMAAVKLFSLHQKHCSGAPQKAA